MKFPPSMALGSGPEMTVQTDPLASAPDPASFQVSFQSPLVRYPFLGISTFSYTIFAFCDFLSFIINEIPKIGVDYQSPHCFF